MAHLKMDVKKVAAEVAKEIEQGETPDIRKMDNEDLLFLVGGLWMMEASGEEVDDTEIRKEVMERTRIWMVRQLVEEGKAEIVED